MRALSCVLRVVTLSAVCATLTAQELPTPAPQAEHKLLAKEAGTWDCDVKMYFQGPEGPAIESKAVEKNEMVSGGLFLMTTFNGKMGDTDFEGHGLTGYDANEKKYSGVWVDNFTTSPTRMTGEYDESGTVYTAHSTVIDPGSGEKMTQKQITTWIDDSKRKFEIFLVVDAGGRKMDVKLMEMVATKRK